MSHLAPVGTPAPSLRTEVVAGLTTFLATAYIVVVNPAILSDGTGMPFDGVLTATVLLCAAADDPDGGVRAAAVRRRAGHGAQRVLRLHAGDRAAGALADRARA